MYLTSLCPIILLLISTGLGTLIKSLIIKSTPVDEFLYCSNTDASNPINIPYWFTSQLPSTSGNLVPGSTGSLVYLANFDRIITFGLNGPPGTLN
jgi:hypothetical protein